MAPHRAKAFRLHPNLIQALRDDPRSQTEIVETALIEHLNLNPEKVSRELPDTSTIQARADELDHLPRRVAERIAWEENR